MEALTSKWHMHRMGMVDFWYYVNEEFYFKDGHMLLRGSNGSGKSVTMQSFLPLLLDGNKSSERLDPFGTRSRKMETYLLEENGDRNDRIGYLYLEFKRADSDVYKTIGMGMHARTGKPMDTWYFVIEDNKRINRDIMLMEHNIAITKNVLKNRIGETQLIESQSAYMSKVNQVLFGFETLDTYKEAINLLLQLRSPKLSNSLRPTKINEILSASLQPLSEEDLRPMSEAISNMDNLKDQLDALKLSLASAKAIHQVYDTYNHALLFEKQEAYLREYKKEQDLRKLQKAEENKLQKLYEEERIRQESAASVHREQELLLAEKKTLGNEDMQQLVEQVHTLQTDMQNLAKKAEQYEEKLDKQSDQLQDVRSSAKEYQDQGDQYLASMKEEIDRLEELQETLAFEDHALLREELFEQLDQPYDFTYVHKRLAMRLDDLRTGLKEFNRYDMKKAQYETALEAQAKHQQQRKEQERLCATYEQQYDGIVEESREIISQWAAQNTVLCFSTEQVQGMMQLLGEYEEKQNFYQLYDLVQRRYEQIQQNMVVNKVELQQQLQEAQQRLDEKRRELKDWQDQKDAQPQLRESQLKNRAYLKEQGIAYVPFYQLLEFDDTLDVQYRNRIEEALLRMGILDALLVQDSNRSSLSQKGMEDTYFFIKQDPRTLSSFYLHGNSMEEIEACFLQIFEQLHQEHSYAFRLHEQFYRNGVLQGTLAQDITSIYIGKESRRQYRLQMIAQMEEEAASLQKHRDHVQENVQNCEHDLDALEKERKAFLKEDDLHLALTQWKDSQRVLEHMYQKEKELKAEINEQRVQLEDIGKTLQVLGTKLCVPIRRSVFEEREALYQEYQEAYIQLQIQQPPFLRTLELIQNLKQREDELYAMIAEMKAELEEAKEKLSLQSALCEQKQKQLQEMGYEEMQQRLQEIEARLQVIPEEISKLDRELGILESDQKTTKEHLQLQQEDLQRQQETTRCYYEVLMKEIHLGYVGISLDEAKMIEEIETLKRTYGKQKRSELLKNDLQTVFYNQRTNLQEYQLTIISDEQEHAEEFSLRLDIFSKYKGKKITFPELIELLQRDIDLQSNLLADSDRHLFEDILVNTISKKIRVRIFNSRNWIAKMNRYMDSMNTSSGLKINLQWKSKKAETREELDTKHLVELLEKEPRMLKDEDIKRLSSHFRSKIAAARKLQDMEDNTQSFHQLMRQIMDYREWYEFKILAQKTGENKKELTNTAFYAYSGGEKAMTMYIPLFSAVAAKFESAREDAPTLIALDEAFAGVDEKNIDNMFSLITKFGFDYIMNSQVLWGDYASVTGLAIYELFRPENARFVTVIPYEWDGHVKRMRGDV